MSPARVVASAMPIDRQSYVVCEYRIESEYIWRKAWIFPETMWSTGSVTNSKRAENLCLKLQALR